MNRSLPPAVCAIVLMLIMGGTVQLPADVTPRSVSSSRQFIVYGGDARLRGAVGDVAERVKADLLKLLRMSDRWEVAILVNLRQRQANLPELPPAALTFSQTGSGLKIQLDVLIDTEADIASLPREVLRALLLEMSYRSLASLPAGQPYVAPPDWLVDGILTINSESPAVSEALERIPTHPLPLRNFLVQRPALLDAPSRTLHSAYASLLVRILLGGEDGPAQLANYIADLPRASNDSLADLRQHFPFLGADDAVMEKDWTTNGARVLSERRFALAAFDATSQQLDTLLQRKIARDDAGKIEVTLEQTVRARRPRVDKQAAAALMQELMLLGSRAHPLLQAVVRDYQQIAERLLKNKTGGLRQRFTAIGALRAQMTTRMRKVDDFMNWFEATQARTQSGAFRDYLRAADNDGTISRRHDALSVYLDAMETQVR